MMRNNKFSIYCFFVIMACAPQLLHAMEDLVIMSPMNEVFGCQLALIHAVEVFDHKMVNVLALVGKNYEAIVRDTTEYRKQYFIEKKPYLKEMKDLEWNVYGTTCAKVSFGNHPRWLLCEGLRPPRHLARSSDKHQEVMIEKLYLSSSFILWHYDCLKKFHGLLPHKPPVIVSGKGDIRFYGYGNMSIINAEKSGDVVEYGLYACQGIQKKCMAYIPQQQLLQQQVQQQVPLMIFLEFPSLLKAFLNSSLVRLEQDTACGSLSTVKVYDLAGVVIPDDYREHKEYFSTIMYKSFKKLPKYVCKAIDDRYNAQHEKKAKKVGLLSCFV